MISHNDDLTLAQIEASRLRIQCELDAQKTAKERNKIGQYATPPALALQVAHYVHAMIPEPKQPLVFCEPAMGTGAFYSALLQVFPPEHIAQATGVEIDAAFAAAARELWNASNLEVIEGDFTTLAPHICASIMLANPPYSRHHHLTTEQKQRLQTQVACLTGIKVNGLAGFYIYFMLMASAWLQQDGIAAWLIPSEWMDVNYGSALKTYLLQHVSDVRIHRFDPCDVQFADALVSSAVVIFRNVKPQAHSSVEITYGGSLQEPTSRQILPREELAVARKWTLFPCHKLQGENSQEATEGNTLGDFFDIKRGIATGANKVFIMSREEAEQRNFPASCVRPILPSPRQMKTTIIEADEDGYPQIAQPLCIIDCDLSAKELQSKHSQLWNYLQETASQGFEGHYILAKRRIWYKQEVRAPAPFLCTYMGRDNGENKPFRFLWNRSQATATNLYLLLYPKGHLAKLLQKQPDLESTIYKALNRLTDELSAQGRFYGGGLHKIEPNELKRVSAQRLLELIPQLSHPQQLSLQMEYN